VLYYLFGFSIFFYVSVCQCDKNPITRTQEKFQGKSPKVDGFKTVPNGLKTVLFWNLKFNFWVLPWFWVWSYFPEFDSGKLLQTLIPSRNPKQRLGFQKSTVLKPFDSVL